VSSSNFWVLASRFVFTFEVRVQVRGSRFGLTVLGLGFVCAVLCSGFEPGWPSVAFAQETEPGAIEPARAGLRPVPLPPLDALEPAVADELRLARQRFDRAVVEGGDEARATGEAYGAIARLLHAYEFFESAEAAYLNAAQLASGDARWPHLLGYLYQQTGRLEEAAEQFLTARRRDRDNHSATVRLGEVYLGLNRLPQAREEFDRVAEIYPAAAQKAFGEIALRQRRYEDAIRNFRAALARAPEASSLHYSLAMAYRGLGRLDEARAHLDQRGPGGITPVDPLVDGLQALVQGERALVTRGRLAYEAGQFEQAADAFRKALAVAPSSVAARVNLGLTHVRLGNATAAIVQFEAALALDAANVAARSALGQILARRGRDEEAVEHLRVAFDQAPGDLVVRRELVGGLLRLGRQRDAIDVLTRVRTIDPGDEDTVVSLGILLAGAERFGEALAILEDGYRQFPDRVATATTLARLLASSPDLSLRDGRRALGLALAIYKAEPVPVHAETVAMSFAELGRCADAAEWMRRAVAEAEAGNDAAEVARLAKQASEYATVPCRP
jgi:tetratricopeptide (TPR) repeat protein